MVPYAVSFCKHVKTRKIAREDPAQPYRYNISFRHRGTSHVTFRFPTGDKVTIPAHKPIKPVYIQQFTVLLDQLIKERATDE